MASITLAGMGKTYPGRPDVVALEPLDLTIAEGELVVLVGPSGCGKSTALRCIGGLERLSCGKVLLGDREVQDLPPGRRDMAMVFQNYALYPHLTVYRNLAFPLREQRVPKAQIDARVRETAQMLALTDLLGRRPGQLSGGQRQRVAMGRALVREPQAFLLDEPLSNLDAQLRTQMRSEIGTLHRRLGITSVYVTHDQVEAMTLGHRIAVLKDGRLQQVGPPAEVYARPANLFVAGFLGTPSMNVLPARVLDGVLTVAGARLHVDGVADGDVVVGLRPEALSLSSASGAVQMDALVTGTEELGNEALLHATVAHEGGPDAAVVCRVPPGSGPDAGSRVRLGFEPSSVHLFDAASGLAVGAPSVGRLSVLTPTRPS
jgi:sn-glycerol 3-phosphate transport system ATP-binding protein